MRCGLWRSRCVIGLCHQMNASNTKTKIEGEKEGEKRKNKALKSRDQWRIYAIENCAKLRDPRTTLLPVLSLVVRIVILLLLLLLTLVGVGWQSLAGLLSAPNDALSRVPPSYPASGDSPVGRIRVGLVDTRSTSTLNSGTSSSLGRCLLGLLLWLLRGLSLVSRLGRLALSTLRRLFVRGLLVALVSGLGRGLAWSRVVSSCRLDGSYLRGRGATEEGVNPTVLGSKPTLAQVGRRVTAKGGRLLFVG